MRAKETLEKAIIETLDFTEAEKYNSYKEMIEEEYHGHEFLFKDDVTDTVIKLINNSEDDLDRLHDIFENLEVIEGDDIYSYREVLREVLNEVKKQYWTK